jgi:uncharacterized membrane protein YgcG
MTTRQTFDAALDEALELVRSGRNVDEVVSAYPQFAGQLRPLLETVIALDASAVYQPPTPRLAANFSSVQQALRAARGELTAPRWWQRKLTFASLSLPVGVLAFALFSAGGAAAATVAVTSGVPDIMTRVEHAAPGWTHALLPGHGDEESQSGVVATVTPDDPPSTSAVETPGGAPAWQATTPAEEKPPIVNPGQQPVSLSGVIANVRGNTFELTSESTAYKVQIDANTIVAGTIAEGATASVEGQSTGDDRVHAVSVSIDGPPPAQGLPPQQQPEPPGKPETTHTPPGQSEKTKTPPGQGGTQPPQTTRTPPGQGGTGGPNNGNGGNGGEDGAGSNNGGGSNGNGGSSNGNGGGNSNE